MDAARWGLRIWTALVLAGASAAVAGLVALTLRADHWLPWLVVSLGWLVVYECRPRRTPLPPEAVELSRDEAPELRAVVEDLSGALGVRPPDHLAVDLGPSVRRMSGPWGRSWLLVGLPVWSATAPTSRLALLAGPLATVSRRGRLEESAVALASHLLDNARGLLTPQVTAREQLSRLGVNTLRHRELFVPHATPDTGVLMTVVQYLLYVVRTPFDLLALLGRRLRRDLAEPLDDVDRRVAVVVGSAELDQVLRMDPLCMTRQAAAAVRRGHDPFEHLGDLAGHLGTPDHDAALGARLLPLHRLRTLPAYGLPDPDRLAIADAELEPRRGATRRRMRNQLLHSVD